MKEQKGIRCVENEDGSRSCERVIKKSNGEIVSDGQEFTVSTDQETCEPIFTGDITVFDGDQRKIDEIARRMSAGCKRRGMKGYT